MVDSASNAGRSDPGANASRAADQAATDDLDTPVDQLNATDRQAFDNAEAAGNEAAKATSASGKAERAEEQGDTCAADAANRAAQEAAKKSREAAERATEIAAANPSNIANHLANRANVAAQEATKQAAEAQAVADRMKDKAGTVGCISQLEPPGRTQGLTLGTIDQLSTAWS